MSTLREKIWAVVMTGSAIIGFFFPVGGIIYYAVSMDGDIKSVRERVTVLENQIKAPIIASSLERATKSKEAQDFPQGSSNNTSQPSLTSTLVAFCMDMAKRSTDAHVALKVSEYMAIDKTIADYGCADIIKSAGGPNTGSSVKR